MPKQGLTAFSKFVSSFSWVTGLALAATLTAPFAGFIANVGPFWPEGGVPVITFFAQLFALIWVYHFWSSDSPRKLDWRIRFSMILLCLLAIAYLGLVSAWVQMHNGTRIFSMQLKWDPVSSPEHLALHRITLLLVWVWLFVSLVGFVGAFVIAHTRDQNEAEAISPSDLPASLATGADSTNTDPVSDTGSRA